MNPEWLLLHVNLYLVVHALHPLLVQFCTYSVHELFVPFVSSGSVINGYVVELHVFELKSGALSVYVDVKLLFQLPLLQLLVSDGAVVDVLVHCTHGL